MRPLIGMPARALNDEVDPWLPRRQGVFDVYVEAIIKSGGIPVMIPLNCPEEVLREYYAMVDGLLFAGGGDVTPELYGEIPKVELKKNDPAQDANEILLARWSLSDFVPTLGICRGLQLINVVLGGSLYQDLIKEGATHRDHNESEDHKDFSALVHAVQFGDGSYLSDLMGSNQMMVNSLHHQGVKKLAPDLRAVAWSHDGVLEAAEGMYHPYLHLVQFHPEQMALYSDARWQKLFDDFVARSAVTELVV